MADFNSSLPVRTENSGDLISKICDATTTSQQLKVNADGSIDTNATISATNLDIRDLVFATDKVDASGSEVSLSSATLSALENITVSATDLDIRDLAYTTDSVTAHQGGSWSATVSATDLDIRDLSHSSDSVKIGDGSDFLAINSDGSLNVKISDGSPGTEVTDYNTATVASNATSNHTYTSTGNFYLQQISGSASGAMKMEVKVNAVTKYVFFTTSANPTYSFKLEQPLLATSTQTVVITRTNRDKESADLYSTISGYLA